MARSGYKLKYFVLSVFCKESKNGCITTSILLDNNSSFRKKRITESISYMNGLLKV